jgi:hypothetical protein
MSSTLVVIHERLGVWARQLRPRLAPHVDVRWVETRSTADLEQAVAGSAAPIVVIDLADRTAAMLADLDAAAQLSPGGLFLVLDRQANVEAAALARELGATLVFSGFTPPPRVAALLERWIPLARRRSEADGWARPPEPTPELWDRDDLLGPAPATFGGLRSRG